MHRLTYVILTFCLLIHGFSGIALADDVVSEGDMENYISIYLDTYKQLIEGNFENEDRDQNWFYAHYPYKAEGVLSNTYGAVVFFTPDDKETISTETIDERIEYYVWPNMKKNDCDSCLNQTATTNEEIAYYYSKANLCIGDGEKKTCVLCADNEGLILERDLRIIIAYQGCLRLGGDIIYEDYMILKGSYKYQDWSPECAEQEAYEAVVRTQRTLVLSLDDLGKQVLEELESLAIAIAQEECSPNFDIDSWTDLNTQFFSLAEDNGYDTNVANRLIDLKMSKLSPPTSPTEVKSKEGFWDDIPKQIFVGIIVGIILAAGGIILSIIKRHWLVSLLNRILKRGNEASEQKNELILLEPIRDNHVVYLQITNNGLSDIFKAQAEVLYKTHDTDFRNLNHFNCFWAQGDKGEAELSTGFSRCIQLAVFKHNEVQETDNFVLFPVVSNREAPMNSSSYASSSIQADSSVNSDTIPEICLRITVSSRNNSMTKVVIARIAATWEAEFITID